MHSVARIVASVDKRTYSTKIEETRERKRERENEDDSIKRVSGVCTSVRERVCVNVVCKRASGKKTNGCKESGVRTGSKQSRKRTKEHTHMHNQREREREGERERYLCRAEAER
jgi:hypothetical protein